MTQFVTRNDHDGDALHLAMILFGSEHVKLSPAGLVLVRRVGCDFVPWAPAYSASDFHHLFDYFIRRGFTLSASDHDVVLANSRTVCLFREPVDLTDQHADPLARALYRVALAWSRSF